MTNEDGTDRIDGCDGIGEIDRAELARRIEEHRPYLRLLDPPD